MQSIRFYDRVLQQFTRREVLNIGWALGAGAVLQARSASATAQPIFTAYPFSLGVASGDPAPDGVVLWTRLAPDPLNGGGMPMANVAVDWEVADANTFRNVVQKGTVMARPELGHAVHVEVSGLSPGREYFYRFRTGDEVSQIGRTKTAPAAGSSVEQLRFAVCGCSNYEDGFFTAYGLIAAGLFDFVFHTGDYIYETRANGGENLTRVRQHLRNETYTVVDYRNRYAQYKTDPHMVAAHMSAPFIVTWDDHEVENDYAADIDENDTPAEVFLLRRAAAYQAYYEHMPLRRAQWPNGPAMRLHRRLQFGTLIDLNVLDTRQYRSDQACGGGLRTGCREAEAMERTMLGAEQERWLFDNLRQSAAIWTVVGQQVPLARYDLSKVNPNGQLRMDKWDGYPAAQRRLMNQLANVRNPVVLSGDIHQHFGTELNADPVRPDSRTVGVEFTNTSISAGGDGSELAANWPAVQGSNPHTKFHSNRRGYIAVTANPGLIRADFHTVERLSQPEGQSKLAASLVVQAGQPRLTTP